jgi:ATP synthase protein I
MQAQYAPIVRRSAAITAVAAAIMLAISAAVAGARGALGALLGIALVTVFYAISIAVVGRAARVSPQAMMIAAITTYVAKILVLLFFVVRFSTSTAFNTRLFGLTAIACILVWSAAQIFWSQRLKTLNVEPAREPQTVPNIRPDGEG